MRLKTTVAGMLTAMLALAANAADEPLAYDIDESAALRKIVMYQKNVRKASGEQLLVFDVTLENVDAVPRMYSVIVHVPGVGAGEDFAPAKGEELVAPGDEATASVAVLSNDFPTGGYSITIRPITER